MAKPAVKLKLVPNEPQETAPPVSQFLWHDNGLRVEGTPSLESCQHYWDTVIIPTKRAVMFIVGDFLLWVEKHYGDAWLDLIDSMDIHEQNVHKAKRVCAKFPINERPVPPLSFTHLDAVSKLPHDVAVDLLHEAEMKGWDRDTLRQVLMDRFGEATETEDPVPPKTEVPPVQYQRVVLDFSRLGELQRDELADYLNGSTIAFVRQGRDTVAVMLSEDLFDQIANNV